VHPARRPLPGADSRFKRTRVDLLALVADGAQLAESIASSMGTIKLERVARRKDASQFGPSWQVTTLAPTQITVNVLAK